MLYSAQVAGNKKLQTAVFAMADTGHDALRTALFVTEAEAKGLTRQSWLEAEKDRDTGLWALIRHDEEAGVYTRKTIYAAVCFFDALYYMAGFEVQARLNMVESPLFPSGCGDAVHYRAAGDAAGVPFDRGDMPHPAAQGKIMTDGDFDPAVREKIAAHSREESREQAQVRADKVRTSLQGKVTALVPVTTTFDVAQQVVLRETARAAFQIKKKKEDEAQAQAQKRARIAQMTAAEKQKALAPYEAAQAQVSAVFNAACDINFKGQILPEINVALGIGGYIYTKEGFREIIDEPGALSVLSYPFYSVLVAPILIVGGGSVHIGRSIGRGVKAATGHHEEAAPLLHLGRQCRKLISLGGKLPMAEKKLVAQFTQAVAGVVDLEQAGYLYREAHEKAKSERAFMKKLAAAEKLVERGIRQIGSADPEEAIGTLKAGLYSNTFPAQGAFVKDILSPVYSDVSRALDEAQSAAVRALPAPAP